MERRSFTFDEADYRFRVALAEEGCVQPDEVRGGGDKITMIWDGCKPITMDLSAHKEPVDRIERLMNGGAIKTVAEITARMSKLLHDAGARKPDAIRPGPESYEVGFIWQQEKVIVIVDRRNEPSPDDLAPLTDMSK